MEDRFRIDSHKLMYHVRRVADWLDGQLIYPIYLEISPSGSCNHRCSFCAMDFMGYKKNFLDPGLMKEKISELGTLGVKSIMFAGEGEPLLNRGIPSVIRHTRETGIDVALTTNGVLMNPEVTDQILDSLEWVKVSLNAGTRETYSKIHGTKPVDFKTVFSNIEYAAREKQRKGSRCTIGIQILLLEENSREVKTLARLSRDAGADYLVVKPYTHHDKNAHNLEIKYDEYSYLIEQLEEYNSETFSVIFRANAMKKWDHNKHDFSRCVCLPFWAYIDSDGTVWGCLAHLKEKYFNYGSIKTKTFKEIWEGKEREKGLRWVDSSLDLKSCKINCRMAEVNKYLTELLAPPEHVNFI